ncbi:MAG: Flp family type IVb pilin [Chlorobiaceae bacterium]
MLYTIFSIKSQKGVTMIEYALIAALVAVVVIATLTTLGGSLTGIFESISTAIKGATTTTP